MLILACERYGRLRVVEEAARAGSQRVWKCVCDCGAEKLVRQCHLRSGAIQSCGCLSREVTSGMKLIHGQSTTDIYAIWCGIKHRCFNPKAKRYQDYGGRGITMCDRWRDSFEAFLADMGSRPSTDHSVDRINNDKGYEPGNCRWATTREQNRNSRQARAIVRSDGKYYEHLADAAEDIGGDASSIHAVCRGKRKSHHGFGWQFAEEAR